MNLRHSLILLTINHITLGDFLICYLELSLMDSNSKFFFNHPQYSEMIIYFEVIDLYLCGLELIKERFCGIASC